MKRSEVLIKAAECVLNDRNQTYGGPEDSFTRIAGLWGVYLGRVLTATDVAAMMALLKIARIAEHPSHADSWIDLAGYAACGGEVSHDGAE